MEDQIKAFAPIQSMYNRHETILVIVGNRSQIIAGCRLL